MKIYVVTSLIENEEGGAEVNVIGVRKTKQDAYMLMTETLSIAKETYEEVGMEYNIEEYEDNTMIIKTIDEDGEEDGLESIEYNIFEEEL